MGPLGTVALIALIVIIAMVIVIFLYCMDPEGRMPYWPAIVLGAGFVVEALCFILWIIGIIRAGA